MTANYFDQIEKELRTELKNIVPLDIEQEEVILEVGSNIRVIPIVLGGSIRVRKIDETGREITLYRIQPGESCILSITSLLNNKPSSAEAVTEADTRLIAVPADKIRLWMDTYPGWRRFVMMLYYDRLQQVLELVDAIAFRQVDERLIDRLRKLQIQSGNNIRITHQSLAYDIGTAREVVSRLLKNLESENRVSLERGVIKITGPL